jgi:acyl-CoA synthetase (AMP-forming)/AMP-acid ligase II
METPLTPLEFMRRTRRLRPQREGVVDGDLRLTYEQFFDRCDRWSTAVQEVAVVGLPHERWGEAPCAFVVLKPGESATAEELREFARARLAHFKVPQWFNFVEELPKTATGKIQKFVLRGRAPAIVRQ